MYWLKPLSDRLYSRTFERPVTEGHIRAAILNPFTYLGMPESVRVGQIAQAAYEGRKKKEGLPKARNITIQDILSLKNPYLSYACLTF